MRHNNNPFLPGKPVPSEQLKGRDNIIRRIVNNIFKGQSTIIVGPFRSGKTSILNYLSDLNKLNQLYGEEKSQNVIFSSVDANEIFDGRCNKNEFWLRVLEPLEGKITDNPALDQA
jgi:ABC-type phosphate transport system ATPase subunit